MQPYPTVFPFQYSLSCIMGMKDNDRALLFSYCPSLVFLSHLSVWCVEEGENMLGLKWSLKGLSLQVKQWPCVSAIQIVQ